MIKRRIVGVLAPVAMTGAWVVLGATPASAAPDCKVIVTNVVNRPDNGHGTGGAPLAGYWADDTHKRTVTVCREPAPSATATAAAAKSVQVPSEIYTAKAVDDGTFVTRAGATLSPNNGVSLIGGRKGKMFGTFEFVIEAPANWQFFDASAFDGKTITGDPRSSDSDGNPTTSQWVNSWWGQAEVKVVFNEKNWSWLYWLCGERPSRDNLAGFKGEFWWDAAHPASNDGQTALAGDIRGVQVCPTPSSVSPTATATPTVTATPVGNTDDGESLPLTGAPVLGVALVGGAILLVGWAVRRYGRKRNIQFKA